MPTPSVASGYAATLVATGLSSPRGAIFDASGHLLVVERGKGVTALTFDGAGQAGCVVENEGKRKAVVEYEDVSWLWLSTMTTGRHDGHCDSPL